MPEDIGFHINHVIVRKEKPSDYKSIRKINDLAFGQAQEGRVIDKIREIDQSAISLVAEYNDEVVGHIFFSSAQIDGHPEITKGMGLAPMAVLPKFQRLGIGGKLINEGIHIIKNNSTPFIIVLGHPEYYPKFGFEPASKYGLTCQWNDISDDAFMVMILDQERMESVSGIARYLKEWDEAI